MRCDYCDYEWVAVSPCSVQQLECPKCHKMVSVLAEVEIISREEAIRNFNRAIIASPLRDVGRE